MPDSHLQNPTTKIPPKTKMRNVRIIQKPLNKWQKLRLTIGHHIIYEKKDLISHTHSMIRHHWDLARYREQTLCLTATHAWLPLTRRLQVEHNEVEWRALPHQKDVGTLALRVLKNGHCKAKLSEAWQEHGLCEEGVREVRSLYYWKGRKFSGY